MNKYTEEQLKLRRARSKAWYKDNYVPHPRPPKRYPIKSDDLRWKNMWAKFKIREEEYTALLDKQNGLCGICGKTCTVKAVLSVDHDHVTGKIRGLLCSKCNLALGGFGDSVEIIKKALAWLNNTH